MILSSTCFFSPSIHTCMHACPSLSEKAPDDAFGLWTLESIEGYFKALGKRQLWLPRERACKCVQFCQQFTVAWRNGFKKHRYTCMAASFKALFDLSCMYLGRAQCAACLRSGSRMEVVQGQAEKPHATGTCAPVLHYALLSQVVHHQSCKCAQAVHAGPARKRC